MCPTYEAGTQFGSRSSRRHAGLGLARGPLDCGDGALAQHQSAVQDSVADDTAVVRAVHGRPTTLRRPPLRTQPRCWAGRWLSRTRASGGILSPICSFSYMLVAIKPKYQGTIAPLGPLYARPSAFDLSETCPLYGCRALWRSREQPACVATLRAKRRAFL